MAGDKKRLAVHFSGSVQGVGFRFTARALAGRYIVAGFVRNLRDGRVELVVEGDESDVRAYVQQLMRQMSGFVRNREERWSAATGEFEGFEIRF